MKKRTLKMVSFLVLYLFVAYFLSIAIPTVMYISTGNGDYYIVIKRLLFLADCDERIESVRKLVPIICGTDIPSLSSVPL